MKGVTLVRDFLHFLTYSSLSSLKRRRLWGHPNADFEYLKGDYREDGEGLL